uniref:Thioredoxin n=1 Tax=Ditylenchus dipsaci TaxID=166011 RepID=A0A915E552_9BILA
MVVLEPKDTDEFEKILKNASKSKQMVVVDFFATWCGPCRMMGPKFHKMAEQYAEMIFVKLDVEEHEELVGEYDVKVMPTFVFIKNNDQVEMIEGNNEADLRAALEKHHK